MIVTLLLGCRPPVVPVATPSPWQSNDWLAANVSVIVARLLRRAADILDHVDLTPAGLRADLAGPRRAAGLVHSTAEIINRAADLCSDSAGLVNDNERRWRVFRERVVQITGSRA